MNTETLCSACRQPIHRDQPRDCMGKHMRHRNRCDCLYPLRQRIRELEEGIEQEAADLDGEVSAEIFGGDKSLAEQHRERSARLRALLGK